MCTPSGARPPLLLTAMMRRSALLAHLDLGPECVWVALQDGLHRRLARDLALSVVLARHAVAVVAVAAAGKALTVPARACGAAPAWRERAGEKRGEASTHHQAARSRTRALPAPHTHSLRHLEFLQLQLLRPLLPPPAAPFLRGQHRFKQQQPGPAVGGGTRVAAPCATAPCRTDVSAAQAPPPPCWQQRPRCAHTRTCSGACSGPRRGTPAGAPCMRHSSEQACLRGTVCARCGPAHGLNAHFKRPS